MQIRYKRKKNIFFENIYLNKSLNNMWYSRLFCINLVTLLIIPNLFFICSKPNSGMKLHKKRKHDIDQIDGITSINEPKELSENQNKCIESETEFSKLTGKIA